MEQHISQAIASVHPLSKMSTKQELEAFNHIELSEEEMDEAILAAKKKKELLLEQRAIKERAERNRQLMTKKGWSWDTTEHFMRLRAAKIFDGKFKFDGQVAIYFQLLVFYFSRDEQFYSLATHMEIKNASLDKGLYLGGNFGVGKTWLMRLFQRNNRQVFTVQNAKAIADDFERDGEKAMSQFKESPLLPSNDIENFFHTKMGLCIDDLGTEQIKNHYGNKKNVIGDLIELRYASGNTGDLLHVTTNLTGAQMSDFYGGRVASRLREIMNVIDFVGSDLRQ